MACGWAGGNLVRRRITGLLLCVLIGINLLINSPIAMPRFWTGTIIVAVTFGMAGCAGMVASGW
jgi:hypothetical protein